MKKGLTVHRSFHIRQGRRSCKELRQGKAAAPLPSGRVPRVSRLLALAIRFDQLIRDGDVTDQAELARVGHVSRARLTQLMNLLHLAPDIQETILFLPRTEKRRDPITERDLRPIAAITNWRTQRRLWNRLCRAKVQED